MQCSVHVVLYSSDLSLDVQDSMGRHEVGTVENVTRLPVNNDEGCHFKAHFKINRVCILCSFFIYEIALGIVNACVCV